MLTLWPALLALSATPPALAVVDVEPREQLVGLSAAVTKAVLDAAQAQGFAVTTPTELEAKLTTPKYQQLRACAGEPACVASLVGGMGFGRMVMGTLGRDEKNYLLRLWLIDVPSMTVVADVDRAILIATRRFQRDVEQAIPPLLRGEKEARGTLELISTAPKTQVYVNGVLKGTTPLSLSLKPGKYEVKGERPKYLPVTRLFTVEADQTTKETLRLLLQPGELPDDETGLPAIVRAPAVAGPAATPSGVQPATVVVLALAGVGAGVAVGLGAAAGGLDAKLRAGYDAQRMVYAGTRAQALEARTLATGANVAMGLAGAAAVAGVVLLVVDLTRPGTSGGVSVVPLADGAVVGYGGAW